MNPKKYMVIDTSRLGSPKMYITSQVERLEIVDGMWHITFNTSSITYTYRYERIKFYKEAEKVDVENRGFYLYKRYVKNISELYRFKGDGHYYYHAIFCNGTECDYDDRDIYVSRTTLDECGGDLWTYLNQLATEFGIEIQDVGNILKMQYDIVDTKRDNVPLAQFIGDKTKLARYIKPKNILYPFGCNASQKECVENALTNQVSIIQGPPGTGKTQTILNIIANLLINGKSVLVVSNNNSAVENVAEKLSISDVGLGFLIAQLGNKDNKERFIANQSKLPEMLDWEINDEKEIIEKIKVATQIVSHGFEKQTKLAKLKVEKEALNTESKYNELLETNIWSDIDWLRSKPSKQLMAFKYQYELLVEQNKKPNLLFYCKWILRWGFKVGTLLHLPINDIISNVESAYYEVRKKEIDVEISDCENYLNIINMSYNMAELRALSLKFLKHKIAIGRKNQQRALFSVTDIKSRTESFLKEYPIVLSTTYTSKNCISRDSIFDYVIMDEASQIDITTGALALSCATNAVIVGDNKQLHNVIDSRTKMALNAIEDFYHVDDRYRSSTHCFLQSCCEVFINAPKTLLREHYRCHPKIIEFCNHLFYDDQLITMTQDNGEDNVLTVIRTAKGQHARGHYNQREIDVIQTEVLPHLNKDGSIGIITPFREQAQVINSQLSTDMASTVHKYQGRECDSIILSIVDNKISEFSDDPNLLNVAISRAKSRLVVVVNGNEIPSNSNLGQLIAYVNYNNFEINDSNLHSIFDLLYKQYTEERLDFEIKKGKNLGEISENLIYHTLQQCIQKLDLINVDVLCHYPLSLLISDYSLLDEDEKNFVDNERTHVDFLIYNSLTKRPICCLEVDGWSYHQIAVQQKRDKMKDFILNKYGLNIVRISTVQTITEQSISALLSQFINLDLKNS